MLVKMATTVKELEELIMFSIQKYNVRGEHKRHDVRMAYPEFHSSIPRNIFGMPLEL